MLQGQGDPYVLLQCRTSLTYTVLCEAVPWPNTHLNLLVKLADRLYQSIILVDCVVHFEILLWGIIYLQVYESIGTVESILYPDVLLSFITIDIPQLSLQPYYVFLW